MRNIKSRAWDFENHIMIDADFIDADSFYFSEPYIDSVRSAQQKFEIMQFVGLKDKNNVEIYQGDIIKSFGQFVYEVVTQNGTFGYIPDKHTGFISLAQNYHFEWTTSGKSNKIEVVGNIYENLELL